MRKILSFFLLMTVGWIVLTSEPADLKESVATDGAKTITLWGVYDLPEVYKPIIEQFKKQYPQVQVEYSQFPNFQEYHEVLLGQLKRGKGPDIFLFQDQHTELYRQHLLPTNADYADGFSAFVQTDLVANNLLSAVPLWADTLVTYYNEGFYPDGIAPGWHDFAHQTKSISISGIAMGRMDNLKSGWDIISAIFLQKGIRLSGRSTDSLFDSLEFFTRFAQPADPYYNWSDNLADRYPDLERESFARKKVAAVFGFSPVYDQIRFMSQGLRDQNLKHAQPDKIKVAPFPQFDPEHPVYLGTYTAVGVSLYSKSPNLAWAFVKLLTSPENAEYFSQATGRIPGRILPIKDSDSPLQKIQKEQLKHAQSFHLRQEQKDRLAPILEKSLKDRSMLREVMEISW